MARESASKHVPMALYRLLTARLLSIMTSVIWTDFVCLLAPMMQFVSQKRLSERPGKSRVLHLLVVLPTMVSGSPDTIVFVCPGNFLSGGFLCQGIAFANNGIA